MFAIVGIITAQERVLGRFKVDVEHDHGWEYISEHRFLTLHSACCGEHYDWRDICLV